MWSEDGGGRMSKDDKKEYEYKVSGYKYQLVRDMAFDNKAAIDDLVETMTHLTTSESEMLSLIKMLEDEVREREAEIADLRQKIDDLENGEE
jgi:chromosome segregation ATPase